VKQAQEIDFSDLATKADIAILKVDLANLRSEFGHFATKADLSDMRTDMIKWIFTIVLGQGALIVALLKLLPGSHL